MLTRFWGTSIKTHGSGCLAAAPDHTYRIVLTFCRSICLSLLLRSFRGFRWLFFALSLSECPSVVQITRLTSAIHRVRRKSAQRLAAVWQGFDETERKPVPIARVRHSKQGATVDVFDNSRTSFARWWTTTLKQSLVSQSGTAWKEHDPGNALDRLRLITARFRTPRVEQVRTQNFVDC